MLHSRILEICAPWESSEQLRIQILATHTSSIYCLAHNRTVKSEQLFILWCQQRKDLASRVELLFECVELTWNSNNCVCFSGLFRIFGGLGKIVLG